MRTIWITAIALLLVASGPGSALLQGDDPAATHMQPDDEYDETATAAQPQTDGGVPSPITDFAAWNQWSHRAPFEAVVHHAQSEAPESGQKLIPKPDTLPGYEHAEEEQQREAWRSWWFATAIAAMRSPSVPLDPQGAQPDNMQDGADSHQDEDENSADSPLGEPHSLERLWRLQAHGPPRIVLPAGDADEMYLVTDRGVLFVPSSGAQPDWMLNLEGIAGHADVIERDAGHHDLVVGMHSGGFDDSTASIWVIDGEEERVSYQGLRGGRALLHWTLTDVDGDGETDILGIDKSGNITAIKIDGEEIYRTPVPQPDLPEATLPDEPTPDPLPDLSSFPVLAMTRTGTEIFGDATGDGTMDIYTTSFWGAGGLPQTSWVTLVDGGSGDEVWTMPLEPAPDAGSRLTSPTVTGDLTGDGQADVNIWDFPLGLTGLVMGQRNIYLDGEAGSLIARDTGSIFALVAPDQDVDMPPELQFYIPLAFTDLNGDGEPVVVAIEGIPAGDDFTTYFPAMQVRELPVAPGGPTTVLSRHELELDAQWLPASEVQSSVRKIDGQDLFIFLAPDWATGDDEPGVLFTLDADGFRQIVFPEPIGHFDIHPDTGQRFAWTLSDDRFTPVDEDLQPTGNGTRMIMSADPILAQSLDGGVPDLLIPRTLGYFWVSGRTGAIMSDVDRPLGTETLLGVEHDGRALVLERDEREYMLFDVREQEELGSIARSALPEFAEPVMMADVTGDGALEALFHEFGGARYVCDPDCRFENGEDQWTLVSFEEEKTLWTHEVSHSEVVLGEFLPEEEGNQLLVVRMGIDDADVELFTLEGSEAVWSKELDFVQEFATTSQRIALITFDDDGRQVLIALDAEDGSMVEEVDLDEEGSLQWMRTLEQGGDHLLVHSYSRGNAYEDEGGDPEQYVVVTDLESGEEQSRFDVLDPILHVETTEVFGRNYQERWVEYARPGPSVGDWDEDGHLDIALREGGWPSVRSLDDGRVLAVGTMPGSFNEAIDLNGDGRFEVGMMSGGSLRVYAYNDEMAQVEREDPLERVDAVDPDEGDQNATDFFDREDEDTPGPGALVIVAVIAMAGILAGRRNRRS